MDSARLLEARIVVCDDQEANVVLLERILAAAGYRNVVATMEPLQAIELCTAASPDLVLLDLHMPHIDGFEVMQRLAGVFEGPWLPILVLTADTTLAVKQRALSAGARDFLTKPFEQPEVLLRIENLLETRLLQRDLREHNRTLEQTVAERTADLDAARLEALERLALAAEYRDDTTGEHAQRVGRAAAELCSRLGCSDADVALVRHAAPLHDVGKIAIPDAILTKPALLTPAEYAAMQRHVELGRRILSGSRSPLLRLSEEIAAYHHERWDGSGYPAGLRGEEIPLSARIVAVVDVFDALTHERPYKPAWSVPEAVALIAAQAGTQFDRRVVDAFLALDHQRLNDPVGAARATPTGPGFSLRDWSAGELSGASGSASARGASPGPVRWSA